MPERDPARTAPILASRPVPESPVSSERSPARGAGRGDLLASLSASRLAPLAPLALFALLLLLSWDRWFSPFQDSGRELATAWRLATGELLYKDVVFRYGPLPPLADAAALRLFGVQAGSLVAVRLGLSLAGLWAAWRLARRLVRSRSLAAAAVSLVVGSCFFLTGGGAWPFPYSGAALAGHVGTWVALELALGAKGRGWSLGAGILAGLAAGTKAEILPVALAGPLLALALRRPRREALEAGLAAVLLAGAAWTLPVLLLGSDTMTTNGFLVALHVPAAWTEAYSRVFWGGATAEGFLRGGFVRALGPSAAYLALSLAFVALAGGERREPAGARATGPSRGRLATCFVLGLLAVLVPGSLELNALLPLAVVGLAWTAWGVFSGWTPSTAWTGLRARARCRAPLLAVGASMLPAVSRQPFSLLATSPYAAFSAPLALLVAATVLGRRLGARRALPLAAFVAGLACAQAGDRVLSWRLYPREEASFVRGRFLLYPAEARLLRACVESAREQAGPGERFATFPEAGIVNFLADRRSPFADEQFFPGSQDAEGERRMVRALATEPPRAILVVDRNLSEFGARGFADGYLGAFASQMARDYEPAARLGDPSAPSGPGARAATATLWLRRAPQPRRLPAR